ncbi:hypothetical protein Tco_0754015 [Tanacetum coccineum]
MLDQTFDRLQKLVSQLELLDEKLSQKDVNKKLLRNLSPEWNTHAVVWMNKAYLDTMSMDDLYNNLNVYEPEVKGMLISSNNVILYYHLSNVFYPLLYTYCKILLLNCLKFIITVIIESLVKKKKKGILKLKRRHLKNTIFYTYTPYPAMKIRHISASSA